ncbi:MAG: hypothetical protein JWQ98_572 [Chlorobi bacterium]|nr:hypothetical protein [Chlorobiota bacterium]
MNRSTFHRVMIAFMMIIALVMIAGAGSANAQIANQCCTFRIIVSNAIPNACMPMSVTTSWGSGAAVQTDVVAVKGNGNPAIQISSTITCPPAPVFDWVSLDGGITTFTGPGLSGAIILPCGTCVKLATSQDVNGCIEIRVVPC